MFFLSILSIIAAILTSDTGSKFRPAPAFLGDQTMRWSEDMEDYIILPHKIRFVVVPPPNNGYYTFTKIRYDMRDNDKLSDRTKQLLLFPMILNHTEFMKQFTYGDYWISKSEYRLNSQNPEIWVENLPAKTAFRFQAMQCFEMAETTCTQWSDYKVLSTAVPTTFQQHEYVYLDVRGTGLNNHHASYVYVDGNVLLKNAFFKGLWLIVLNRKDLSLVHSQNYDTMKSGEFETVSGEDTVFYDR